MKKFKKSNVSKVLLPIILVVALLMGETVMAADQVDGSYLLDNEISASTEIMPRGVYLHNGYSNISKVGNGQIAAGGTTTAQTTVSTVKVSVIVERYIGGNWYQYTSWSETKYNASYASSSKILTVPVGYYYRTRCIHSANTDASSSSTNGLYI